MKKIIYSLAVVMVAAMMVSCGGKSTSKITKGSKSKLDTLSYAIGVNIATGVSTDMPEMKFDMKEVAAGADKALVAAPVKEDKAHEEAITKLQNFFSMERPKRMQEFMGPQFGADSLATAEQKNPADMDIFNDEKERKDISYAYGYDMGVNLRNSRLPLQTYWLEKGLEDVKEGNPVITNDAAEAFLQNYFMVVRPAETAKASQEWLASIEKKSGVQKTASGLLYRIDKEGDADIKPTETDVVKVNYEGKLSDGYVFDSSYERGEPVEFPLNRVIKGWTEGVQLIGKGGQITLWIPSELGYGAYGQGPIGPNEAMEFKVELIDVKSATEPQAQAAPAEAAEAADSTAAEAK